MERGESTIVMSGHQESIATVRPILEKTSSKIFEFGDQPGAANVAKICGNFLIATSIESLAEAYTLAKVKLSKNIIIKVKWCWSYWIIENVEFYYFWLSYFQRVWIKSLLVRSFSTLKCTF